ncbi:hypothetical protein CFBP6600_03740 [Xanthomonas arboricola pv. corylina]|uniref:O-methyltransferase n=1 Tax=Xanthomonas arboricola pv. corylina TaxID=487821 RepID=A0ABN7KL12_9XANT|nr:hypothetical protein XAC301_03750 [Xanthomonas arboricola pv. corylina]CAE6698862.1 hypothetical protein XAC301_03750 [Xanthomonas arboricola pv. corylina]CAE6698958.1 hypothetical protein CFBP6600_03740 [Xanthomonas arboricola pv. corylina]CAE6698974.1 hypothetical protein CFBP6600_03740 [Xanthomonas arboricola pv. corylina]
MLRLGSSIEQLLRIREEIGWLYGSEDLCVLLYSLVKREKPAVVVELGTGLGVSTAWMAAAMKETGKGTLQVIPPRSSRRQKWNFLVSFSEEVP